MCRVLGLFTDPPAFVLMYALILVSREAQFMLGWRHK